jgi:hypothetical protein
MIVCIFEHAQWRWASNDILAHGYRHVCPLHCHPDVPSPQGNTVTLTKSDNNGSKITL